MKNAKPAMNDTSVRIPAHAHGILSVEKTRIRIEEKKHAGIGTLAGLYIERAEMLDEALAALEVSNIEIYEAINGRPNSLSIIHRRNKAILEEAKALP